VVEALALRGSHRSRSLRPQWFSQECKSSLLKILTGVEVLTLGGSHRGVSFKDKLKIFILMFTSMSAVMW